MKCQFLYPDGECGLPEEDLIHGDPNDPEIWKLVNHRLDILCVFHQFTQRASLEPLVEASQRMKNIEIVTALLDKSPKCPCGNFAVCLGIVELTKVTFGCDSCCGHCVNPEDGHPRHTHENGVCCEIRALDDFLGEIIAVNVENG